MPEENWGISILITGRKGGLKRNVRNCRNKNLKFNSDPSILNTEPQDKIIVIIIDAVKWHRIFHMGALSVIQLPGHSKNLALKFP